MDWLVFLLAVLATYRVSFMIVSEDGPFNMVARWRRFLSGKFIETRHEWIYIGFTCVLCVSFWLSWLVAALLWLSGFTAVPFWLMALGIAGAVLLLHKYLYG